jgi:hypothetical protein
MFTRIMENYQIIDAPETAPDPEGVALARVAQDAQGNITVDTSVRKWVGPLNDDTSEVAIALGRLRLGGKSIPNSQWPSLTASGPNEVTVDGSLKVSGNARVTGNIIADGRVGIGADAPGTKLHVVGDCIRLEAADRSKRVELRADGFAGWLTSPTSDLFITCDAPGGPNRIILNPWSNNGNVGIGTADPKAKLHVEGSIASTMWNVTQPFVLQKGPLPLTSQTFETKGGILLIFASGSGFRRTASDPPTIGVDVNIIKDSDNAEIGSFNMCISSNAPSTGTIPLPSMHITFVANARVLPGIPAGKYKITITLKSQPHTVVNSGDFFSVTVLEMPWQPGMLVRAA